MTLSEDFNFADQNGEDSAAPAYPVVFGISFTPQIIGIIVGVIGLGGAIFLLLKIEIIL